MEAHLRRFNGDNATREALKEFLLAVLDEYALEKLYKREDVSHIADAKEVIEKAFEELDIQYGTRQKADKTPASTR